MKAVCPGSFDPITHGHVDVIGRAAALFDEVIVAVGRNSAKNYLFDTDERVELSRAATADLANVRVEVLTGLLVDYCRDRGAQVVVKGLRFPSDFDFELPPSAIAVQPAEPRDHARLFVHDRATRRDEHAHVYDLPSFLRPGDLLVLNDTKVVPWRLRGRRATGGAVECLLVQVEGDVVVPVEIASDHHEHAARTLRPKIGRQIEACWRLGARPDGDDTPPPDPETWREGWGRLRRWAHMLGFGGHFSTRSRRYSTTLTALRQARRDWARAHAHTTGPEHDTPDGHADEETTEIVVASLAFAGIGWHASADALLANTSAAHARARRRVARDELTSIIG